MTRSLRLAALASAAMVAAGCAPGTVSLACEPTADAQALAQRASPYDSVLVAVGSEQAKVCYGRPSARGRTVFGDLIPFDTLWRTGANEPTILHLAFPADIAGLAVDPGKYSIYTVPSASQWQVIVNASTSQWGITRREVGARGNVFESAYTDAVRASEVGRAPVTTAEIDSVEQLTISTAVRTATHTDLLIDWQTTRIVIPIRIRPA